jgi:hypothetical protein
MYEIALVTTALFWCILVIIYVRSNSASVFNPLTYYLFFHGLVFVIRPIIKYIYDFQLIYVLYGFAPSEETRILALFAANVGLLSFLAGSLCWGNVPMRFPGSRQINVEQLVTTRVGLLVGLAVATPLIGLSFIYALNENLQDFDVSNMIVDPTTYRPIFTNTTGYVADANIMLGAFGVGLAWIFRFRWIWFTPLLLYGILRMAIGWGRYSFIMALMSVLLLYTFDAKRKWIATRLTLVGLCVIPIFHTLGAERTLVADWLNGREYQAPGGNGLERQFLDGMDFANLEYLEYVIDAVPNKTKSYDYFLSNLEIFTAPIPRMFWGDKPVGPPIRLYNLFDYGTPIGMTWTLVGEGWQDLGILGVVVWCFLGGTGWGLLYRLFVRSAQTPWQVLGYLLLLPLSVQWFRDGVLISLFKFPLFFLLPVGLSKACAELPIFRAHVRLGKESGREHRQ